MEKHVLVPVADGVEEIEAVCIIDVLRRAGAVVTVAGVDALEVTASRGVRLVADRLLADCGPADWDLVVLPGGMPGAERLRDTPQLVDILRRQQSAGRPYAAICAAPAVVLESHGLLAGRTATAHPGFLDRLARPAPDDRRVVVDGPVVTSRGPGTAIEFALALVEMLFGRAHAREVAAPMMVPEPP